MKKPPIASKLSGMDVALKEKAELQKAHIERARAASLVHSDSVINQNLCIDPERVKLLRPAFGRRLE
ncbi:MAG: hypothetical protein M1270_01915 [Gammaproteobacteria bacterium]|nr:hypothetical protein [Gammaproteobacteria bacterium]